MDRRTFVHAAAAFAALPTLPIPRVSPKFGYAAITWGGNDRAAIDDIAAVGFRGIQLRASAVTTWTGKPEELRALLAQRDLTFVALSSGVLTTHPATAVDNMAMHVRHAEFAQAAGCLYLQVVDERPRGRPVTADDYKQMGRALTELGKRTADLGVTLGYHNHMGNLGQAPEEVARVLDAADMKYVKLELDIAHFAAAGGDAAAAVRRYADHLLFVHLKDLLRPAPGGRPESYRFVELGRGQANVGAVLAELVRAKFGGWAIVELDSVTDPLRTAKASAQISKQFLEANGFTV
ncbi:MAG: sugar phosphate isomerase/epimerase [Gemmatimonadaceae bacterium]|nr:sugar phosphate isomerase/epimerase [Gemmatimonadaceae bacterium]